MSNLTESSFGGSGIDLESNFEIDLNSNKIPINETPDRIQKSIVCIILEGSALILVDGVKYALKEGMILSVFPQQVVEELSVDKKLRLMYFTCSKEILNRILFRFPPTFEFYLKEYPTYILPHLVFEYDKTLIGLLYNRYLDKNNIARNEIVLSYLRIFFIEIFDKIRQRIEVSPAKQIRQHEIFRNFINLLATESKKSREVQYYAEKLNITPKYLSVITQSLSGQGSKKIIDNYIIMEVKLLLKSTNLTMQEITNTFNFPDQAFFCKFFKTQTGYTPKRYRGL